MAAALSRAGRRPGAWGRPPMEGLPELREWFARSSAAPGGRRGAGRRGRPVGPDDRAAGAGPARRPGAGRVTDVPGHAGHRPRGGTASGPGAGRRGRCAAGPARRRLPGDRRPCLRLPAALPEPDRRGARPRPARGGAAHRARRRCLRRRGRLRTTPGARGRRSAAAPAGRRRPGRCRRPRLLADQGDLAELPAERARRPRSGAGAAARHPGRRRLLRPPTAAGGGAGTGRFAGLAAPSAGRLGGAEEPPRRDDGRAPPRPARTRPRAHPVRRLPPVAAPARRHRRGGPDLGRSARGRRDHSWPALLQRGAAGGAPAAELRGGGRGRGDRGGRAAAAGGV